MNQCTIATLHVAIASAECARVPIVQPKIA